MKIFINAFIAIGFLLCGSECMAQNIPTTVINARIFGIKGDGSDETSKFRNAINALATRGGGTLYIPKGIYYVSAISQSAGIIVGPNTRIKGDGINQTILKRINNDVKFSRIIVIKDASNVSVEDITIDGNKDNQDQSFEQQHNIFCQRAANLKFNNVEYKNTVGDGLYFSIGSRNVIISNCIFNNITRVGINCTNLDSALITGCNFENIITNGIKIEKNQVLTSSPSRNILVTESFFSAKNLQNGAAGININGLSGDLVDNFKIVKNKFKKIDFCVTGLRYVDDVLVEDNIADSVKSLCRSLSYSLGVGFGSGSITVQNNKISSGLGDRKTDNMVFAFYYFKNVLVKDNTFVESKYSPYSLIIVCIEDQNIEFVNNSIISSGTVRAIVLNKCNNINFNANYFKINSSKNVIEITDDPNIHLKSLNVVNNTFDGNYKNILSDPNASLQKATSTSPVINYFNNKKLNNAATNVLNVPAQMLRLQKR
ncbi:right-handed parallel beta-helix repeat-containing protein [Mucilaginibacter ximonensis]|uniref:right-handed parallel beta-helix repeat-containing protein n=1 Tax=Mucilaginibacter ximonensis TaxID=538021 RepID=UPI00366C7CBD